MRIVITGALGHIGSRLIRELPVAFPEAKIVMIDNLSTQRHCSLYDLPPSGRYQFVEADVCHADLEHLFEGTDVVVHLAATTGIVDEAVEQANFEGAEKVARACMRKGAALIFPSSTSVYTPRASLVREDCGDDELQPQSSYARSKLKTERMLIRLGSYGLRFVTCRFGTIFGVSRGMRFHTAVNKFCWQAAMGQSITVWRTALDQSRAYLDLADGVAAIQFVIARTLSDCRAYNVLTVNTTVRRVLEILTGHYPRLSIEYVDSPLMNELSFDVDRGRFQRLGFRFQGDLARAIEDTVRLLSPAASAHATTEALSKLRAKVSGPWG